MNNRAVRRFKTKFGKFLDPFVVAALFLLFLIPAITVINLTPGYMKQNNTDVLGLSDTEAVRVTFNNITNEYLSTTTYKTMIEGNYEINVATYSRPSGRYSYNFMSIENNLDKDKYIFVTSSFSQIEPDTQISLTVDGIKYILVDRDGNTYSPGITLRQGEKFDVGVMVENDYDVSFSSNFTVHLSIGEEI
ncbi:hypothetical protein JW887_01950 [Candidatus Dojkabacteria bacterium]|nr:hypothetical protein [Candidatus Dojkabacteria bacterium]